MSKNLKNTFGLKISNSALIAVELSKEKKGIKVVNFAKIKLNEGIIEDNCIILNPSLFKEALTKLLLEGKNGPIKAKNVIISIPEEKTFSHIIQVPADKTGDEEYIKNIAKDFIPIELEEAIIDYQPIKNISENKNNIEFNFVAVQQSIISHLINVINEAGFKTSGVDIDKNSLIRFCLSSSKNENGIMIISNEEDKTELNIVSQSEHSYDTSLLIGIEELNKQIKEALNCASDDELNKILKSEKIAKEQEDAISQKLQPYLIKLKGKINELIKIAKNQEDFILKTIYLIGPYSKLNCFKEICKSVNTDIKIAETPDGIEMTEETNWSYYSAIGLALKSIKISENKNEINLLPTVIKEKIEALKMEPVIKRYLLPIYLIIIVLSLFSSILMTESYLQYKITEQEMQIYNEKATNPYLTETAQANRQKQQLEMQINSILKNAIPISQIIKKLDSYNKKESSLVSINYQIPKKGAPNIRLRAKTISRETTENFIISLEDDPYFLNIESPLSNLVGKGERFINIDFMPDVEKIMENFAEIYIKKPENKQVIEKEISENEAPKKPKIKVAPQE